ncbi:glycoside hydrolase family 13 protein [Paractinoplanes hotanensis]|uniref:Glycoside hydrolase family 13 protein n=1 Tax=Paractinoplanes hotanensis TaxID=2906497 RepID=A0ABT0XXS3_9ACTN|nr:glycoside hydrolase family 13 protein [Actinoplanes hotanensis]MCM4078579.1 glycoside hydrolase family 13 protein [Actinoplanes hotanensis]
MQDTRPVEHVAHAPWWRDAVVYQVYLRSFADGNGDGVGDFAGLRARLPYLAELGVDAVWVTPHYVSGGADGGYDVIDYTAVDPEYGTVEDVRGLIEDAHAVGLRVLLDIVPNHTSDQHPWFQAALAGPDSPEAARYHFRPASEEPPNNWQSMFGGPAWSRTPDGRWYLHLFTPQQPDLNWDDASVVADFDRTLRFWFDLGVDGFRVDVAYGLFKDPSYRDNPGIYSPTLFGHGPEQAMTTNQPGVHEIWRRWRALCDSYDEPKMLVGEVSLADLDEVGRYARPDELHHAFQFRLLKSDWDASSFADTIAEALAAFETVGAPAPWVLGNHDKARQVTRYGSERRARAAALLMLALPGSAYLYAGEELGLPEADVPDAARRDPIFFRSHGRRPGRDGCRIPMPWEAADPNAGFSTATPWLPQPADWPAYAVDQQESDPAATFTLYQQAIMLRKLHPALGTGLAAVTLDGDVIRVDLVARTGDPGPITCWINMGAAPVTIPAARVLLASAPDQPGPSEGRLTLSGDTAVWATSR